MMRKILVKCEAVQTVYVEVEFSEYTSDVEMNKLIREVVNPNLNFDDVRVVEKKELPPPRTAENHPARASITAWNRRQGQPAEWTPPNEWWRWRNWIQYIAVDENGDVYGYDFKPVCLSAYWQITEGITRFADKIDMTDKPADWWKSAIWTRPDNQ